MQKYDYLLFDADNTLFDFHASEAWALEQAIIGLGIHFIPTHVEIYREVNHLCWRQYEDGILPKKDLRGKRFEWFFEKLGLKPDIDRVATDYLSFLSQSCILIPGAEDLLQEVSKNHALVLVTNGLKEVQRPRLRQSSIEHYFETIVVSDEIGHAKPDAAFFDYTFDKINHPDKSKVLMIGDNINADIRGGLQYGLDSCWYNPNQKKTEKGIEPTYVISEIGKLLDLL